MKTIMKKLLAMGLVVTLTAGLAITGTVAYLTDRDSEANVFTVGDVEIDLNEDFEQGAILVPGVKIEKEATITNTGNNDAYVWMTVAVPKAFCGADIDSAADNAIHTNVPGAFWNGYHKNQKYINSAIANGWLPEGATGVDVSDTWICYNQVTQTGIFAYETEIDGKDYVVATYLYTGAIKPGEMTNIGLSTLYLDSHIDIDPEGNMAWVENGVTNDLGWNINEEGNPVVYVSAYGIQAEGFEDVYDAYAAYNTQWGVNGTEYAKVTVVSPESGAVRPAGYAPSTEGEVIDGLTIIDDSDDETNLRALYQNGLTGDLTVKNSVLDGTYAMNVTAANDATDVDLVCEGTTFMGWVSYSGFATASFTDCTFKINSEGTYNVVRPYDVTTFTNCEFKGTQLYLDKLDTNETIKLVNCTYNGEKITNEILATMIAYGESSSVDLK